MPPDKLTHASNTGGGEDRKHLSSPNSVMTRSVLAALRAAGERPVTAAYIHKAIGIGARTTVVRLLNECEGIGFASSTLVPLGKTTVERVYTRSPSLAGANIEDATLVYLDGEP